MWDFLKEILLTIKQLISWIKRKKKTIKEDIEIAEKVYLVLSRVLQDTGADRAFVFQFHNGDYFYTGNSIDKMTNTHEVALPGISREQVNCTNVMVAPYRSIVSSLISKDIYSVLNIDEAKSYNEKSFLAERGVKSTHMVLMTDSTKKPVGFIGIDFVKDEADLNAYSKAILKQAAVAVYELLVFGESKK